MLKDMSDEEFRVYVAEAVASLPEEFRRKLDNVSLFVADYPSAEQLAKVRLRPGATLLLGLYEGIPQTQRGQYGVGPTLPDRITIFKYPILTLAPAKAQAIELIRETVKHEIAHHFGMDEARIQRVQSKDEAAPHGR